MKKFNGCKNYTIISSEELKDINARGYVLLHDKTGARIALIQNDDDNKAFVIGFKTPQDNSTGVPHILEHSVLCGSDKYPVKDAMSEVMKGSLNTFLNAITYPDKTVYPCASYNDKDFRNLMSVYLDAVFFPRVHKDDRIFKQEGWHYELESEDGEITYNGVVYNEMKGVYSSPQSVLGSYSMFSLFPDTQYGVESGGDPDVIPELSYEEFTAFHRKLYNPSNARIFLYGDMDFEEKLEFIDREYLSKFEKLETESEIIMQKPFDRPVYVEKEYSVSDSESDRNKTLLSYNVVVSDYEDRLTNEAMNAIEYALCGAPGSILERRLLDAGIGTNIYPDYVTDMCQKCFSIVAEDANPEDRDRFVEIIEDTIREIIDEGFNKKSLEAAITTSEFSYREADFGYYPKGVVYAMMTFDDWLYTDDNIFSNLKLNSLFAELREGINNGLFEKILKERILDNNHKSIVLLKPKHGLQKEKDEAVRAKLKAFKDSLSKEEIKKMVKDTAELKAYQEAEDSEEALKSIPTLTLSDISKEAKKEEYSIYDVDGITEMFCNLPTNGIAYFNLSFVLDKVPYRLLPAISVLKSVFGLVDTDKYTYTDLSDEVNIVSGGIMFSTGSMKSVVENGKFRISMEVRSKALVNNVGKVFDIIRDIIFTSHLDDKKRIRELIDMELTKTEDYMVDSGHSVALNRAMSYFSKSAKVMEVLSGLDKYAYEKKLSDNYDEMFDSLVSDMREACKLIFNSGNLVFALGAEEKDRKMLEAELSRFVRELHHEDNPVLEDYPECEMLNEGLSCASLVQYVALTGNFINAGLANTPRLGILRNILSNEYLWTEVRLKGGAYGVMCGFAKTGEAYFVSYRDPNLKNTLDVYKKASDYIKNYSGDREMVDRYIITTIGDNDTPLSSSMMLNRAFNHYRMGITNEMIQKERDILLSTTIDDLKELYKYIDAVVETGAICTVGGEEMLKKEGDIFNTVRPLIV